MLATEDSRCHLGGYESDSGKIVAFVYKPDDSFNVWANYYTGPAAVPIIAVAAVIVSIWVLALTLNYFLKKRCRRSGEQLLE